MRVVLSVIALLVASICTSCTPSPKPFESNAWKQGDKSARGAMVEDLIEYHHLIGKSSTEIRDELGKPDHEQDDYYGYDVVTIGRCRFWKCSLDISFDSKSSRVISAAVSD
jgi:hypothetical protein